MKRGFRLLLVMAGIVFLFASGAAARAAERDFAAWLEDLRREALSAGISRETLKAALADIEEPLPRVIAQDRSQPDRVLTLEEYVESRVAPKRIADGRRQMKRFPTWLGRVEGEYGVQRRFIVALWGMESSYGQYTGNFPVVQSLATLAYEGRRGAFFRRELLDALRILEAGHVPVDRMVGSWAGAMGQCQFIPSSFLNFGVDADGDGHIDIWNSVPDVLGSIANYLARTGWKDDQTWGRPVRLPQGFDFSLTGLDTRLPLARWQALGVRRSNGNRLPGRNLQASLVAPDGPEGPAYLVYGNFRRLLSWNRSIHFAVAVGTLSDRLDARK